MDNIMKAKDYGAQIPNIEQNAEILKKNHSFQTTILSFVFTS
jgi:hypothetical protein